MAAFPDLLTGVKPIYPIEEKIQWKTLFSNFEDVGNETRKQKWLYPKRDMALKYSYISQANIDTLWEFFNARKGSYEAFNLFLTVSNAYTGEYVGTGDGATTVFNLPSKTASSYTLYKDGATMTAGGTDYTFGAASGADGADKATMTTAPAAGEKLSFSFTGYLKIRCRFLKDDFTYETFVNSLHSTGVELKGLLNE